MTKEKEGVRKVRDSSKREIHCYNCGKKGHKSGECHGKVKCFNCQKTGHISSDCREVKRQQSTRGRRQQGRHQGSYEMKRSENGHKEETSMKTKDEAVMYTQDQKYGNETKGDWQIKNTMWLLDSGSTSHMTCDTSIFSRLKDERREISLADKDGKKLESRGTGEVVIEQVKTEERVRLKNVLCVPDLNSNLMSVAKITDHGYNVTFIKYGAEIYKENGEVQMRAKREGNAYYIETKAVKSERANRSVDKDI